jgi:hypothetical protein
MYRIAVVDGRTFPADFPAKDFAEDRRRRAGIGHGYIHMFESHRVSFLFEMRWKYL